MSECVSQSVSSLFLVAVSLPRYSRNDFEVLEAVKAGMWEWPEGVSVSNTAKSFVAGLLVVDPVERLSCDQALKHDWMQVSDREVVPEAEPLRATASPLARSRLETKQRVFHRRVDSKAVPR